MQKNKKKTHPKKAQQQLQIKPLNLRQMTTITPNKMRNKCMKTLQTK